MNQVRISKKNPNRTLKAIQFSPVHQKQPSYIVATFKNSNKIQRLLQKQIKNQTSHKIVHSHRYKNSEHSIQLSDNYRNYSPGIDLARRSCLYKKNEENQKSCKQVKGIHLIMQRSTDKSPYLDKRKHNKSERKITVGSKSYMEYHLHKGNRRNVRFNSLEERSDSLQIQRDQKDSTGKLQEAKRLMLAGECRKSLLILKPLVNKNPSNHIVLEMVAKNLYNIGNLGKAIQYLQSLIKIKPDFSPNSYILMSKILLQQDQIDKCLAKLEEGIQVFPYSQELHLQKGLVLFEKDKVEQALKEFYEAEEIDQSNLQVQQLILNVLQLQQQHQKVLQRIQAVQKKQKLTAKQNLQKCKSLFKLKNYDKVIQLFQQSSIRSLLYYVGYSFLKKQQLSQAYLTLQASLSSQQSCQESIKLMLLILCKSRDFYEASHLIKRCQHLQVAKQQLLKQFSFIEGTLCLMKRNMQEGVDKLNQINNGPKNNDEFSLYVQGVINSFLGYGNLCLGNFQICQQNYLQQKNKHKNVYIQGVDYNILLNKAFLSYKIGQFQDSLQLFVQVCKMENKKVEPFICSAIVHVNIYNEIKISNAQKSKQHLIEAKNILQKSSQKVIAAHSNVGAYLFFHKSILHAYMQQWRQAIESIDDAIQKSQQNYWRFYYVRALSLGCIHNFSEAINDCSAAINLKQTEPAPYLLRAKCFQIQGQGNLAFKDLQTYVSLRPEDNQVHILAGKLLFQNGAFEDALAAFGHSEVPQVIQYEDAFLTISKTYFLLGKFVQASQNMLKVFKVNPNRKQAQFDSKMMFVLHQLLSEDVNYKSIIDEVSQIYDQYGKNFTKNQIFKKTQRHTFQALCYFSTQQYKKAIKQFESAITCKQKIVMKQALVEGSSRQDEKDTKLYIFQMNFNISLCYLVLGDSDKAKQYADRINFAHNDIFYEGWQHFMKAFSSTNHQNDYNRVEIFPNKNKISHFLQQIRIKVYSKTIITKLCIPFPKVQPPQIFPTFDQSLLQDFSIDRIERKPQAPWICRQENAIIFTSKIQKYSRLQIQQSATQLSVSNKDKQMSNGSVQSIASRKYKKQSQKHAKKAVSIDYAPFNKIKQF